MANGSACNDVRAYDRYTHSANFRQADWDTAVSNIVFPESGQLRSRKVVSRSRARPMGKYPSWKMKRMVQWESENELNAFRLLDCNPDVTSFHEQPCEVMYFLDGKARSHYPDILVEKNGRKELWEVKPESEAEKPEVVTRSTLLGSGANMCEGAQQGQWRSKDYAASTAFQIAGTVWFLIRRLPRANCPLRIRWSSSIPAMVVAAQSKFLKPSIGPVRDLIPR